MALGLGYDPARAAAAKAELLASGRFATVAPAADVPPARSLTAHRLRHLEQGRPGTCWAHAPTQLAEVTAKARGYDAFPTCRRLTAWQGKQYEGGGNPYNGGFGMDGLKAMREVGVAHESLCPYSEDYRTLGTKPPPEVFADARACHLSVPVVVNDLDEAITLVAANTPSCLGIWWPYGWDDAQTFMTTIGRGTFGHELLIVGYAKPGVLSADEWIQLDNWHGLRYPPLDPAHAAKVPGYTPIGPDKTSDFWVARTTLEKVISYGNADLCSASDLDGIAKKVVLPNWGDSLLHF